MEKKKKSFVLQINSLSNPRLKNVVKLLKNPSFRQEKKVFVVDGERELKEALKAGWEIEEFFYCPSFLKKKESFSFVKKVQGKTKNNYELNQEAFKKISYKKTPDGFLAVLKTQEQSFKNIKLKNNSFVLVLEGVEKPGNLGGIIRTAYAAGVDLIILNDQKTDLYSPNVIRSSTGFIFSIPVVISSVEATINWLKEKKIKIFLSSLKTDNDHFSIDLKNSVAVVFGTEAFGLSSSWEKTDFTKIKIPMILGVDSLNVSVSVGIIVYEALRQRGFKKT